MATVLVACKIPNGMILQNFELREMPVPLPGGGTAMEKRYIPIGDHVELNGSNRQDNSRFPDAKFTGGFALTAVDAAFWDKWLAANKDTPVVKNGLIFSSGNQNEAISKAKSAENAEIKTGIEPLEQSGDPRAGKPGKGENGVTITAKAA